MNNIATRQGFLPVNQLIEGDLSRQIQDQLGKKKVIIERIIDYFG